MINNPLTLRLYRGFTLRFLVLSVCDTVREVLLDSACTGCLYSDTVREVTLHQARILKPLPLGLDAGIPLPLAGTSRTPALPRGVALPI